MRKVDYIEECRKMQKSKIDMADMPYVVNPEGDIDDNIWSDICYA